MADYGVRITLAASSPLPSLNDFPFTAGVAKFSSGAANAGWTSGLLLDSPSPLGEQVDISQGGNYASIDDFDCAVLATWWPSFELVGASLYGALVEVGTLVSGTLTVRWSGTVSDISWQGAELRISAESLITQRHRTLPSRILTSQEFAALPADAEGSPVPIVYGAVERMTPASLLADRDYLMGQYVYPSGATYQIERSTTFVASGAGVPALTASALPIVTDINTSAGPVTRPVDYDDTPWWESSNVYMEIFEGTGSGQTRAVQTIPAIYGTVTTASGNEIWYLTITLASPLDTLPDTSSGIRFYTQAVGAILVVGDEVTTESITVDVDGESFPIGFAPGTQGGFDTADVSDEFRAGEDYAAIEYQVPTDVFSVAALSDGVTASGSARTALPYYYDSSAARRVGDVFCRASLDFADVPDSALSRAVTVYFVASASATAGGGQEFAIQCIGTRWDGTEDIIATKMNAPYGNGEANVNGYSPAILADGTVGAFAEYATELSFPAPLRNYERVRFGLTWGADPNTAPVKDPSLGICTLTNGLDYFFADVGGPGWTGAATIVGKAVYPESVTVADPLSEFERTRFQAHAFGFRGTIPDDRRTVASAVFVSGSIWRINLDSSITTPTGDYGIGTYDPAYLVSVTEREVGLLISYGSIPQDSQFLASTSAGRTYGAHWTALPGGVSPGDPITEARDMAQDVLLRDLGLTLSQISGYSTLPSYTASAILSEQEDSAKTLARMCQEFNWIGAHDSTGREVATAWLTRLYTTSADYTVTSADMVEGSITGVDATSLDDVITLPRVSWSSTQADGFREQGTVTDCTADPDDLTPSNYLRTITGFGDYSTALNAYQILHEAWKRSGVRRSDEIQYRYGGNPTDLLLPARMEWAASRKDILTFRVNEGHASAAAYCGQRIAVTHKRYTGGGTAYGTLVAAYWYPQEGQTQLTVMMDPTVFPAIAVMIDTIDPTETVPEYVDTLDATEATDTYVDTLGDG
jgi:hypothetical protein